MNLRSTCVAYHCARLIVALPWQPSAIDRQPRASDVLESIRSVTGAEAQDTTEMLKIAALGELAQEMSIDIS